MTMTVILVAPIRSAIRTSDVRNSAKMSPVGWEVLRQWGEDVARIEPLAGGVANDVWNVRVHRHLAVFCLLLGRKRMVLKRDRNFLKLDAFP